MFNGKPTSESVGQALKLVGLTSSISPSNSKQVSLMTELLLKMTDFLTVFQQDGGSVPVNEVQFLNLVFHVEGRGGEGGGGGGSLIEASCIYLLPLFPLKATFLFFSRILLKFIVIPP